MSVGPGNPAVIHSLQAQDQGLILDSAALYSISSNSQFWSWGFAE